MADNQMVQIDFQFDLGNVPASSKAFANYLKGIGVDLKITKASTDALAASVAHLATAQTQAAQAGASAASTIKKSNMQWTNFALVIQDLPYGFRGIQNNLPALMGGIAGMAGPLYLVGSAVIAFFTAWDSGLIKFGENTKIAKDYTNEFAKSLADETVKFQSLYRVSTDANVSMNDRLQAAKELKKEYPGLLTNYSEEDIALGKAKVAFDNLSASVLKYAKAQAAISVLTDLTKQQLLLEGKKADLLAKYRKDPLSNYSKDEAGGVKAVYGELSKYNTELNIRTYALKQNGKAYNELQAQIDKYNTILDKNIIAEGELNQFKAKPNLSKETAAAKERAALEASTTLEVLKAKQETYKQDILLYKEYQDLIINLEEKQALEQAKTVGASELTLQNIRDIAIDKRLKNRQDLSAKIKKLLDDEVKDEIKAEKEKERVNKDFVDSFNSDAKKQSSDFSQFYKTKLDLATGDLAAQKEILLQQRADLEVGLILSQGLWYDYSKAVGDNVKAVADISAKISKQAFSDLMKIGNGIMQALGPSLDLLLNEGANIGEVLTAAFQSILKQLAKVIIAATIAVALMALLGLVDPSAAVSTFMGLFKQGMGIGGLVGGGTGAGSSGPGVSADAGTKAIQSIQAGASGTSQLTARISGNDLLILMNQASRNNNNTF